MPRLHIKLPNPIQKAQLNPSLEQIKIEKIRKMHII